MIRLEVENLTVMFQNRRELFPALYKISFKLNAGETLGIWGHSGCGKSTVFKSLMALPMNEPGWIDGTALYNGIMISPMLDKYVDYNNNGLVRKNCLGFYRSHYSMVKNYLSSQWRAIFQEPIYSFIYDYPMNSQISNIIKHYSNLDSSSPQKYMEELNNILETLNLPLSKISSKKNIQLSGGECQRISFALSILGNPSLLFADEPTTAIDEATRASVIKILKDKIDSCKISMLIASHNRNEIISLADKIMVLCHGHAIEQFTKSEAIGAVVESYHPYTRKLWHSIGDNEDVYYWRHGVGDEIWQGGCIYYAECAFPQKDNRLSILCHKEMPPHFSINNGHSVACWLFKDYNVVSHNKK